MLVFRRTPISLLNLISQPTRAIVSVTGVAFALLLIFMQLGFRGAVGNTATIVYGKLKGQLVMRSPDYVHLYVWIPFSSCCNDGKIPFATKGACKLLPMDPSERSE